MNAVLSRMEVNAIITNVVEGVNLEQNLKLLIDFGDKHIPVSGQINFHGHSTKEDSDREVMTGYTNELGQVSLDDSKEVKSKNLVSA